MKDSLYTALQECIAEVQKGASVQECLERYPEHSSDLEPLLQTVAGTPHRETAAIPAPVRRRLRMRVLDEWDRRHRPRWRPWRFPLLLPRWFAVAGAMVIVALVGGAGTAAASQAAVPGGTLYPVKEFKEAASLWFTTSPEQKASIYSRLVLERAGEIKTLVEEGRMDASGIALARLEQHLSAADRIVQESRASGTGTAIPAAIGRPVLRSIEQAISGPESVAGVVEEATAGSPGSTYPCLRHSMEAINSARQQVSSALENLGESLPPGTATPAGDSTTLCPR